MQYDIDATRETPIYKQVADAILKDIRTGRLPEGTKLPTVRDMAESMDVSQGTVKRCYEYLRDLGVVEMTQGKGTFVLGENDEPANWFSATFPRASLCASVLHPLAQKHSLYLRKTFTPKEKPLSAVSN